MRGQRRLNRQDLRAILDADVHVDSVQEHLVTPVGGALHELGVALGVGHPLASGARKGVGARGGQVDAQVRGQGAQEVNAVGEVGDALSDRRARLGDNLDRVEEHLAVDARIQLSVDRRAVDDRVGALTKVVRVAVDELELPLDTDRGALGGTEGQGHGVPFADCLHCVSTLLRFGGELPYRFAGNRRQMTARWRPSRRVAMTVSSLVPPRSLRD